MNKKEIVIFVSCLLVSIQVIKTDGKYDIDRLVPSQLDGGDIVEKPFPFIELLNLTGINMNINYNWIYVNRCNIEDCSCENNCTVLGNCCIDYQWNISSNLSEHIQMLYSDKKVKKQSCIQFFPNNKVINDYFIMVDTCPPDTDQKKVNMCLSYQTLPVYGHDKFLYRNKYCAICNKVLVYKIPKIRINCFRLPRYGNLEKIYKSSKCYLQPSDNPFTFYRCEPNHCPKLKATFCGVFKSLTKYFQRSPNVFCKDCRPIFERYINEDDTPNKVWSTIISIYFLRHEILKKQSCLEYFPLNKFINDTFIMVDTCPPSTDQQKLNMCLSYKTLPVYGNDTFLYRNRHCAICNNVIGYKLPDMKITCSNVYSYWKTSLEELYKESHCFLKANDHTIKLQQCTQSLCSRINATFCSLLKSDQGFYHDFTRYSNILCKDCFTSSFQKSMFTSKIWSKIISMFFLHDKKDRIQSCLQFFPASKFINDTFIMVDTCPPGTNQQKVKTCLSYETLPVYGTDKFLYRNKYCAICNNLVDFEMPRMKLNCLFKAMYYKDTFEEIYKTSQCFLQQNDRRLNLNRCEQSPCPREMATFCGFLSSRFKNITNYNAICRSCLPVRSVIGERVQPTWSKIISLFFLQDEKMKRRSCSQFYPASKFINDIFIMVDTCPLRTDQHKVNMCFSYKTLPVYGNNLLYRNKYCAICNNAVSYVFPEMKISCFRLPDERLGLKEIYKSSRCSLRPDDIRLKFTRCTPDRCLQQKATFCDLLKEFGEFSTFCSSCFKIEYLVPEERWSKIISLSSIDSITTRCPKRKETDRFGNCVIKGPLCGTDDYQYKNHKCTRNLPTQIDLTNSRNLPDFKTSLNYHKLENCFEKQEMTLLLFLDSETMGRRNVSTVKNGIQTHINLTKSKWTQFTYKNMTVLQTRITYSHETSYNFIKLSMDKKYQTIKKITVYSSLVPFHQSTLYGNVMNRIFINHKLCAVIKKIPAKNISLVQNSRCQQLAVSIGRERNLSEINFEITYLKSQVDKNVYYCQKYHLYSDCVRQNINVSNYSINKNQTLSFNQSSRSFKYDASEYVPTTEGFQICRKETSNELLRNENYLMVKKAEYYIYVIGIPLSCFGYVLVILAFYLFHELRNTDGEFVLILVLLLLLTDLLLIGSFNATTNTKICKWIGVILYGFSILVCEWIAVFVLYLLFFREKKRTSGQSKKFIHKKFLFCCLLTITLSSIMICLEFSKAMNFDFAETCWIGDFYLQLGFYFVPVSIVYLFCIASLSIVYSIYRQHQSSNQVRNRRNRQNVSMHKIAIKLITILGVCELFGLSQLIVSDQSDTESTVNIVFGVIYNISRSFRGLLICIVYLVDTKTPAIFKTWTPFSSEINGVDQVELQNIS